jgi:hypothetical protein
MRSNSSPFEIQAGSERLRLPQYLVILLASILFSAYLISENGIVAGIGLIAIPFVFFYLTLLFQKPIIGLYSAIGLGFFLLGIPRYLPALSVIGVAMDGILLLTYIALLFSKFYEKIDWKPAKKDITLLAAIWLGYSLLEGLNPEAHSKAAWLAGVRGIALYMMLIIPLVLILINNRKKLDLFLYLWGTLSILVSLKGIMQITIGVDQWEKMWLDNGGAVTHILFGKLRVFSFLSDAANFGANQAYTAVVATIVGLAEKGWRKKIFYFTVSLLGLYGMVISGTRGAISIPLAGFMIYFILKKNVAVMVSGFLLLVMVFVFFKYTNVGQGNAQISRMRSAFDPNDASLQVRLENQKKLKAYLATRPFGGGVGHAGVKAQRYLPNAFLSSVATDSWFVMIWAEQGIVGLILHLFILFYIVIKSSYLVVFRIRDPVLKMKMAALTSGMFGIMVASYGNEILGSLPTSLLIYTSMALMLSAESLDFIPNQPLKQT